MTEIPNDEKFRELILYVAQKSAEDPKFGSIKLNKLLFYADFYSYMRLGKSITGQQYQKLKMGPAPRRLLPAVNTLVTHGAAAAAQVTREYHGRQQIRVVPQRGPDMSLFSPEEIEQVDWVISELLDHNGAQVSELSHQFVGWDLAEEFGTIPYEVAMVSDRKPTEDEIKWCMSFVEPAKKLA